MDKPTDWEVSRDIMIGTFAGIVASTVTNRGLLYTFLLSGTLYVLAPRIIRFFKWFYEFTGGREDDDDDRPYEDVNYAS